LLDHEIFIAPRLLVTPNDLYQSAANYPEGKAVVETFM